MNIQTHLFLTPVFYVLVRRLVGNTPLQQRGHEPVPAPTAAGGGDARPLPAAPHRDLY